MEHALPVRVVERRGDGAQHVRRARNAKGLPELRCESPALDELGDDVQLILDSPWSYTVRMLG